MRLISVRELGSERPWYRFGISDFLRISDTIYFAVQHQGRNVALQYVKYDDGDWLPLISEPTKQQILDRMKAKLKHNIPNARLDAVDDLIELGFTTPEAWKLVWEAMPVEAMDEMEAAE